MGAEGPHFFSFTCYQQIERKQSPVALPETRCPFAKRSERDLSCHAPWPAFGDFHGEVGEKGAKYTFLILTEMLFMVVLVLTHTRGLCLNFPCFAIYPLKITCLCTWGTWDNKGCSPDRASSYNFRKQVDLWFILAVWASVCRFLFLPLIPLVDILPFLYFPFLSPLFPPSFLSLSFLFFPLSPSFLPLTFSFFLGRSVNCNLNAFHKHF